MVLVLGSLLRWAFVSAESDKVRKSAAEAYPDRWRQLYGGKTTIKLGLIFEFST
jgi:hypothetical protein